MTTTLNIQMTGQGILIPRTAFQDWGEVEVVQEKRRIVTQPKTSILAQGRELVIQALHEEGLLVETDREPLSPPAMPEERAELAKKLGAGRPLSEIVIEERRAGW